MIPRKTQSAKTSGAEVIELLKKEKKTFDQKLRSLLAYQEVRLQHCLSLLDEDLTPPVSISDAQRFSRTRARKFLTDIFRRSGAEVFLLCAVAISITKLGRLDLDINPAICEWWENETERPNGLVAKAKEVCDDNFQRKCSPATTQSQPAPTVVIDLALVELLGFLGQNQANSPRLQMDCPLLGSPLPSIDIKLDSSMERTTRIEFSIRASEALIEYLRVSRDLVGVAEVSH